MGKKIIAMKIIVDADSGEVDGVETTKRFAEEGALFRMDVIKDTIIALDNIYDYEKNKFFNENNQTGIA
tara:strand:- start:864 stop:1070 length:207 start_codon:yes stop_codon:yes gene_type:complete